MLAKSLIKGHDKRRLRNLLVVIFLALAIPTAVLVWQGYSQLKWEAFHQYRTQAEELNRRIDNSLIELINTADTRSFADYSFMVVGGDARVNYLQRSPLSGFPVDIGLPGVLGHFQVDADGTFSSPLLPADGSDPEQLGIAGDEYQSRLQLSQEIQSVLAKNQLVSARPTLRERQLAVMAEQPAEMQFSAVSENMADEAVIDGIIASAALEESESDKDVIEQRLTTPQEIDKSGGRTYSQQVFDQLKQAPEKARTDADREAAATIDDRVGHSKTNGLGLEQSARVADIKLDESLQKKSELVELKEQLSGGSIAGNKSQARGKRKETSILQAPLPASMPVADNEMFATDPVAVPRRISTFESEIDPFEFSVLDNDHFVLYRNVWRDGERFIQGLLIRQQSFIETMIQTPFVHTTLWDMSDLIVSYQGKVIKNISAGEGHAYSSGSQTPEGTLLYRNRLSAPLDGLELVFNIKHLPPGPGATVLGWMTFIITLVFLGGFILLYRLGSSQINVARQQQDFVSAVSHELKTPLTSIRMYGEMLKEGWVDDEKRQTYYDYIHTESERLTRLISNVLQLAKITHNEPSFDLRPIRVGDLLKHIEARIMNQVAGAGFELSFNHDEDIEQDLLMLDEDCFTQIIINLVDNAIKFSDFSEHKAIEISSLVGNDKQIIFSVRDFGPGIAKDQMKKIFQMFYRTESELTRETVGTGIGLAIVHQLTVAMNGKVDIINRKPGAEFRLTFSTDNTATE